jgi:hypothetical protein
MRRNWIIAAIFIGGLAALVSWIATKTYWDEVRIPTSLKGDAATNPFYSRQRLAELLGARPERRDVLGTPPAPQAIIMLSSWHWSLIEGRRRRIEEWVEAGGRLVVDRTLIGGEEEFERWSGITRDHARYDEESQSESESEVDSDEEPEGTTEDEPPPEAPLKGLFDLQDTICTELTVDPAGTIRTTYNVCNIASDSWLTSTRPTAWALHDEGELQALRVNLGRGSVTMLNATPFGNRDLLERDHAPLFVAVTQLRRGDQIIFLSEEEQASLLSLMWTHGAPVIVLGLLLIATALWRGGIRFGPLAALPDPARRSIAEQIRGTGQFTLRFGGGQALHAAMVRALHETAERRIVGYAVMTGTDQIAAIARLTDVDAQNLSEIINHAGPRRAGELRNAIMVLEYTRRRILDARVSKGS